MSLPATALLGAVLTLATVAPDPAAGPPATADPVTRVHDLRGVLPDLRQDQVFLPPLPLDLRATSDRSDFDEVVQDPDIGHDVAEILYEYLVDVLAPDEFALPGRDAEALGDDRLLVTASPATHARLAEILAELRAAAGRRAVLEVQTWKVGPGVSGRAVDLDQLAASGQATLSDQRRVAVPLEATRTWRQETVHGFVRDWETEIAQAAVNTAPQMDHLAAGSILSLRVDAVPGDDRVLLRWAQREVDVLDWNVAETGAEETITNDSGLFRRQSLGILEQPRASVVTTTGMRPVRPGDAVTLQARTDTAGGPVGLVTRVRVASVDPPPPAGALRLLSTGLFSWPRVWVPELGPDQFHPYHYDEERGQVEAIVFPAEGWEEGGPAHDALETRIHGGDAPVFAATHGPWRLLAGDDEVLDGAAEALAAFAPRAAPLTVDLRLEEAGADGTTRVVAQVTLPAAAGSTSLALAGAVGLAVVDLEVDVANSASSYDPIVMGSFDGLSLRVEALEGAADVDLVLHGAARRESRDLRSETAGHLERLSFDSARLTERVVADGGEHRFVISGGPRGLVAVLRVDR